LPSARSGPAPAAPRPPVAPRPPARPAGGKRDRRRHAFAEPPVGTFCPGVAVTGARMNMTITALPGGKPPSLTPQPRNAHPLTHVHSAGAALSPFASNSAPLRTVSPLASRCDRLTVAVCVLRAHRWRRAAHDVNSVGPFLRNGTICLSRIGRERLQWREVMPSMNCSHNRWAVTTQHADRRIHAKPNRHPP
jgi:hypothetical protein